MKFSVWYWKNAERVDVGAFGENVSEAFSFETFKAAGFAANKAAGEGARTAGWGHEPWGGATLTVQGERTVYISF